MPLSNLTKYCACHAKWLSWSNLFTHETLFPMRGATGVIIQPHQILRLPRKITVQNLREIWWKQMKRHFQCAADPTMIREWNRQPATRLATEVTFHADQQHFVLKNTTFRAPAILPNFTKYCTCHEKWHSKITKYCTCHEKWLLWLILVTFETLFTMRRAADATLQPHQILRLPRKITIANLREL